MSKAKIAAVDALLSKLAEAKSEAESALCGILSTNVEEAAAAFDALKDAATREFEEQESILDEEEEGALERVEALEEAKNTLTDLAEKLDEFATFLGNLEEKYEEVEQALNNAKADL